MATDSIIASDTKVEVSDTGTTDGFMVCEIDGTERMRVANNGNVGIGNTSPGNKLSVKAGFIEVYHASDGADAGYGIKGYTGTTPVHQTTIHFLQTDGTPGNGGYIRFDTNDGSSVAERARIYNNGIVSLSGQSAARGYLSTSQPISDATPTKIELKGESFDVQGEFDHDASQAGIPDYAFEATVTGYYQVNASILYANPAADKTISLRIKRSGTEVIYKAIQTSNASEISVSVSDIVYLTAGQYLEMFTYHNTGFTETISTASKGTFMSVHKLS